MQEMIGMKAVRRCLIFDRRPHGPLVGEEQVQNFTALGNVHENEKWPRCSPALRLIPCIVDFL